MEQVPLQSLSLCLQRLSLLTWILAAIQGPKGQTWPPRERIGLPRVYSESVADKSPPSLHLAQHCVPLWKAVSSCYNLRLACAGCGMRPSRDYSGKSGPGEVHTFYPNVPKMLPEITPNRALRSHALLARCLFVCLFCFLRVLSRLLITHDNG